MSKVLVTESYLGGIADAIRLKNGASTTYRPGDMAAAIEALDTSGIHPTGTKNITQNGTHDVTEYASANVNVQPNLQSKTATQNGTVTPDQGYDGLSSVVVDVSGGGGGSTEPALPAEYQRVEYLDFTPSIGIIITIPTDRTLYEVDFSSDVSSGHESTVFGYRGSSTNNYDFEAYVDGNATFWFRYSPAGETITNISNYVAGTRIKLKALMKIRYGSTAMIGKYAYYSGDSTNALDGKFYSLIGYGVDNLPNCWFVPCYRKSDNQVGVYDHVAQAFYYETYATGSGYSIVAGPDVT